MKMYVFDLDDTLVRTQELVVRCYVEAGADADTALDAVSRGLSGKVWCDTDVHARKVQLYTDAVSAGALASCGLPPLQHLRELRSRGERVAIITSSSCHTAEAVIASVCDVGEDLTELLACCGATRDEKRTLLLQLSDASAHTFGAPIEIVLIDDCAENSSIVHGIGTFSWYDSRMDGGRAERA